MAYWIVQVMAPVSEKYLVFAQGRKQAVQRVDNLMRLVHGDITRIEINGQSIDTWTSVGFGPFDTDTKALDWVKEETNA